MIFTLNLRTLRPLCLCGIYSEIRLRLCRAGTVVVKNSELCDLCASVVNTNPDVAPRRRGVRGGKTLIEKLSELCELCDSVVNTASAFLCSIALRDGAQAPLRNPS